MKIGQTSVVYFVSRIFASLFGFIATIYFARLLGAEPLGIYNLVIGVVSWLAIAGKIGISGAITKRVSEGEEREQYATAGITLIAVLFIILLTSLLLFRPYVNDYLGHPATGYVVLILFVTLSWSIVTSLLTGLHLVHLEGVLSPIKIGGQSLLQIGAVAAGLGVAGLFIGHIAGLVLVTALGGMYAFSRFKKIQLPQKYHYRSLFNYAKFAWLGNLESRMFNYTDVVVLGFFVPSALIGIYSIAWNIAMFLILFSGSISTTLFPEMSKQSVNEDSQSIANLLEDALSYAGLLLIPGLIGGLILGERILRIYGDEFTQGTAVLGILIISALVRAYQKQLLNTLNAIDRPDLSFRANALFVVVNLSLNVALIYLYGWIGAAVATVLSVAVSLVVAHCYLKSLVEYTIPYAEIANQWFAAIIMGVIVYAGLQFENTHTVLGHNAATVVLLVGVGASVYFATLLVISSQFRTTVNRNVPFDIPLAHN
ncbi:oligosaccharide flippase family protein [Halostagnicola kamekurae]|uniref:Membrane protein involved in the export of O-antigen and teichoic acid n=1 Tax=Halostagnicola kamekurae TaxID=619731 RepID=A0A1I6RV12_9EURY|nr:oligosaccharide flippase family protein [Halostagnicola kamekurae]SFS68440.1 Membrane protein involved in the export of O-antigen and teichoic acid [Halostagnicola kamekurae]